MEDINPVLSDYQVLREKRDNEVYKLYTELMANPKSRMTAVRKYVADRFGICSNTVRNIVIEKSKEV